MRADKFILKHLSSIESNVKLFKSKEIRSESSPESKPLNLNVQCGELPGNDNLRFNKSFKCKNDNEELLVDCSINSSNESINEVVQNEKNAEDNERMMTPRNR